MNKPIGVFDSGVGGLTVAKELMRLLPHEKIVYFGDTARVPYGIKSADTVTKFSLENILFLLKKNVKLVVVACNTSSSLALPTIKKYFEIPLIGVIAPGAKQATFATRNKRVGVIATRATIRSSSYVKEIHRIDPTIKVFTVACPLFVPLVEEGWVNTKITEQVARTYLAPLKKQKVDTLILGCTHYPLLKKVIANELGTSVRLIDSAYQVAQEVKHVLREGDLFSMKRKPAHEFYVTDEQALFRDVAQNFLGRPVRKVKVVNV